ncbi:GH39 family glycosyl hydrolase [Flavobacterium faecale]|uniref:GH39 family glycosyl hydrolase n=1 Tax=Flavobacterium faecale TaxID=1355330 RepID=UPI003AAF4BE8
MKFLQKKCNSAWFMFVSICFCFALISCSKSDVEQEIVTTPSNPEPPVETIDPAKIVTINTGAVVGQMYNFWSTRPMINQTRFNSSSFRQSIEEFKSYVVSYNLVRMLGGRTDDLNEFYKGVDASGNIITDFSGLITSMRNFRLTGYKPRIVLDNVPWAMSGTRVEETYGNSKPANDYNLWRKYIHAFMTALVNEFGVNEVKTWRFRVGTEPNYSPDHWSGSKEDYFKHYDITVDEVLKVIPDAIIGPGNMLTETVAKWDTDLIDHCANGINYATGARGTRMSFFCISYYEKIDQNTIKLPEFIALYKNKLDSYPQFRNIPFDIQEFGMLRDENAKRGTSLNDATELGASWYAAIADMAYKNKITEIYDWGQESEGLATGRRNVTTMFEKMKEGSRLQTVTSVTGFSGIIPVLKDNKIYLLVYNHHPSRTSTNKRTLYPKIEGGLVSATKNWKMNEWTVDKTHGVFMHELYKDVRTAGIASKNGRIYGNNVTDYFMDGWQAVFDANKAKYQSLSTLPQTQENVLVETKDGNITLKVDLEPHSVKLIELIPQ